MVDQGGSGPCRLVASAVSQLATNNVELELGSMQGVGLTVYWLGRPNRHCRQGCRDNLINTVIITESTDRTKRAKLTGARADDSHFTQLAMRRRVAVRLVPSKSTVHSLKWEDRR